ncbi:MAG: DUF3313 domain-containing protein [Xanthomonadales bacterium]|nr:DUF3313 domain-containing protein [Xanthomonadales bacterium]
MRSKPFSLILVSLAVAGLASSTVWAKDDLPAINADGMELVKHTKMTTVYKDPGTDLSGYTSFILEDASVAFKKNWKRDQNRQSLSLSGKASDKDMQRIRDKIAASFKDVFAKELAAGGYQLVDQAGDSVLIIRPAIVNLDVNAPDLRTASRTRTFAESAGEMTLNLELIDSLTNDKVVVVSDRKRDLGYGFTQWRTSSTNQADAKRMMMSWAKSFREALDEAKNSVRQGLDEAHGSLK